MDFHDPLTMNFAQQAASLLAQIPPSHLSHHQKEVLHAATNPTLPPRDLLAVLSEILAHPAHTMVTTTAFRPLLLDLCARWLDNEGIDEINRLEALALLLEIHEEIYPVVSAFLTRPSLKRGPLGSLLDLEPAEIASLPAFHLHRILILYYRLLHAEPDIPDFFNWSLKPLALLLVHPHPDSGVRYLAIRCYAIHSSMPETERKKLEEELLGALGEKDVPVRFGERIVGETCQEFTVDGWLLPLLEAKRIQDYRDALLGPNSYYGGEQPTGQALTSEDLSPCIVNLAGVLFYRHADVSPISSPLVETSGTICSIRQLALQLSRRVPSLITAPPGSGKSLLIQHLAYNIFPVDVAGDQIVTIHLSDTSLDAKALLGSYSSSATVPGTFEWVEGVLVRAMKAGKWVVLKDIDKANPEVLGMTMPLVESLRWGKGIGERAHLAVPGQEMVQAAEAFMLFATRSSNPTSMASEAASNFPPITFLGHQHWSEVQASSPSYDEQEIILGAQFPKLRGSRLRALLGAWITVEAAVKSSAKSITGAGSPRDIGMRDLERWIRRVDALLPPPATTESMPIDGAEEKPPNFRQVFANPTLVEEIFLEAKDSFVGFLPPNSTALVVFAKELGAYMEMPEEQAFWLLNGRTPDYEVQTNPSDGSVSSVRIGHSRLLADIRHNRSSIPPLRPFALHRPSLTLLSRLASALPSAEPILLVGETGTGKTTSIQHLAALLSRPLTAINLSNQTASSDLLGGYKPIGARVPALELQQRFYDLFTATFSAKRNEAFMEGVKAEVRSSKWKRVVKMWKEACKLAKTKFDDLRVKDDTVDVELDGADKPRKRRKITEATEAGGIAVESRWAAFERDVTIFEAQHILAKSKFVFSFVEGPLVNALRHGHWVLLDEINLASAETLESITPLLQSSTSSITLTEQGSLAPIPRHPTFRIFASMNPATDVGKKDLPPNLRSRFTELWVPPPDHEKEALLAIVSQYIGNVALSDKAAIMDVAEFYMEVRKLAESRAIADGSNKRPHFSMRTLARAMTFAADVTPTFGLRRALWEGCLMAFTMTLDEKSAATVKPLAERQILRGVRNVSALLSSVPSLPKGVSRNDLVQVGPFWLKRGPLPLQAAEDYILTPSVQTKLMDLARIILTRRFPVLIEGPTSAGKTSAIEYLARRTGHRFVRINNHEHTDIQEYVGTYVSDPDTGKLVFQDGLLVRALRQGHWIVLDELNLAPTDVLEALNRLLDDNRELVIPETGEVVRPHVDFMLFATQNPSGTYAGRKVLSRAFRNRFLEVHFTDVPQAELEVILAERCKIPPSRAQRIVAVFQELQKRRQTERVFETKQSFATLRDLFRWASRDWRDKPGMTNQDLAEAGYMLLAERARRPDDKNVVKEVLESVLKVKISEEDLYSLDTSAAITEKLDLPQLPPGVVWTAAFRRLFCLVSRALRHNEPVLLVGETGCGKTSVCELFAHAHGQVLHALNCHQNTETADLLGSLRPIRNRSMLRSEAIAETISTLNAISRPMASSSALDADSLISHVSKCLADISIDPEGLARLKIADMKLKQSIALFEWQDGPLVQAMRNGDVFLLDEISLADDSVLERLNSVLEPSRSLVLAEKGGSEVGQLEVTAAESFKLVSTMNPGGDYGKKELSPALRNRFTEIWVPPVTSRSDKLHLIAESWRHPALSDFGPALLEFCEWVETAIGDSSVVGLRDILGWVTFSNEMSRFAPSMPPGEVFHHAARMTIIDGLPSLPQTSSMSSDQLASLATKAELQLQSLVSLPARSAEGIHCDDISFSIGPFGIPVGTHPSAGVPFNLNAPTTQSNAMRILRACLVKKPILLEGSPGVGKTSLVSALAAVTGHRLCRINLSDQSDLMDLYGSDLPVEGGSPGEFVWKDAAFLQALQQGHWVLLDEMNLAPQAVLEGLNAVLDHRGTVYIPELGRSFRRHPDFRIFAAQNPLQQGGGRKGLPKSFLNRFTKVYVKELSTIDYELVCQHLHPDYSPETLQKVIQFNMRLMQEVVIGRRFGREGSPWEFNLRDILRWLELLKGTTGLDMYHHAIDYVNSVYISRFRNSDDRQRVRSLYDEVFGSALSIPCAPWLSVSSTYAQIGHTLLKRQLSPANRRPLLSLKSHLPAAEAMLDGLRLGALVIVSGRTGTGKSSLVRHLANLAGVTLREFAMHPAVDTSDLLGSFEQVTPRRTVIPSTGSAPSWDPNLVLENHHANAVPAPSVQSGSGRFEWVDGPLVSAVKEGHWLMLDNANLCNASVLDRLNSLCEHNGTLVLNERGLVDGEVLVLTPHPNFRLFMVLDPRHGELSRAMRNRGIEVSLSATPEAFDLASVLVHDRVSPELSAGLQPTAIEAVRRGVGALPRSSSPRRTYNVIDDTDISYLAACTLKVIPSNHHELRALQEHYYRLCSPDQIRLLDKILRSFMATSFEQAPQFSPLRQPLLPQILQFSEVWKRGIALTRGVPSTFLCGQPIDPVLNPNLIDYVNGVPSSSAFKVMKAVEIVVELLLVPQSKSVNPPKTILDKSAAAHSGRLHGSDVHAGVRSLYPALQAIWRTAENFVRQLAETPEDSIMQISNRMGSLLSYAKQLRRVASQEDLDFSSINVICQWMNDELRDSPRAFSPIQSAISTLKEAVSVKTGQAMYDVWRYNFSPAPSAAAKVLLSSLDELSQAIPRSTEHSDLRRVVFDHLAIARNLEEDMLLETSERLRQRLQEVCCALSEPPQSEILHIYLQELLLIAYMDPSHPRRVDDAQALIHLAVTVPGLSPKTIVPLQRLVWAVDASDTGIAPGNDTNEATASWMKALWAIRHSDAVEAGPGALVRPSVLQASMDECNWSNEALEDITNYDERLRRLLSFSRLELQRPYTRRAYTLSSLLIAEFTKVLEVFKASFDGSTFLEISNDLLLWKLNVQRSGPCSPPSTLSHHLHSTSNPYLRTHLQELFPLFNRVGDYEPAMPSLSKSFISLGQMLVDLYVPDTPLDPLAAQMCTFAYLEDVTALLQARIKVNEDMINAINGASDGPSLWLLRKELEDTKQRFQSVTTTSSTRVPNLKRLHSLFSEIGQFCSQLIEENAIQSLVAQLEKAVPRAKNQESTIQGSIAGFLQRLETAYSDQEDLIRPFALALEYIRFGLRLLARSVVGSEGGEARSIHGMAGGLTAFPRSLTFGSLESIDLSTVVHATLKDVKPAQWLLFSLETIALDVAAGTSVTDHADVIEGRFDQLLRLWLDDTQKDQQKFAEDNSIYRRRTHEQNNLRDEELEEEEFSRLFPKYTEEEEAPDADVPSSSKQRRSLDENVHHRLCSLQLSLFDSSDLVAAPHSHLLGAITHHPSLSHELDEDTVAHRHLILSQRLYIIGHSQPITGTYDFYHDPNIPETRKTVPLIQGFIQRVNTLLEEWPEQMVLRNLRERAEGIIRFGIHSPVPKVLAALERLLLQTEDWERYAHKGNSLNEARQAITTQIVEWRRLELSCWAQLIETQGHVFAAEVDTWWYRLYETIIRGTIAATESGEGSGLDSHLAQVSPLLDQFMARSPLGQYNRRLQLIRSFSKLGSSLLPKKGPEVRTALQRMVVLVQTTHAFWSQFCPILDAQVAKEREQLDKSIQDFIKLASWRDINVHALKASAEKTHRQLHKCIRSFREILRKSVEPIIQGASAAAFDDTSISDRLAASITNGEPALVNIELPELMRLSSVVSEYVHPYVARSIAEPLDALATDIIDVSQELASTSTPSGDADAKAKAIKELVSRKRRAVADFMKQLKDVGLPSNLKPEALGNQQRREWLLQQEGPLTALDDEVDLTKAEVYHHRLLHIIPLLREAQKSHHSDVTSRDFQRALAFVESSYDLALTGRSNTLILANSISHLRRLSSRALKLASGIPLYTAGPDALAAVTAAYATACRLAAALTEIHETALARETAIPLPPTVSEGLIALTKLARDAKAALSTALHAVSSTSTALLFQDEYESVQHGLDNVTSVQKSLTEWSRTHSEAQHVFLHTLRWLESTSRRTPTPHRPASGGPTPRATKPTNAVLVVIQNLLVQAESASVELPENFITEYSRRQRQITRSLQPELIVSLVESYLIELAESNRTTEDFSSTFAFIQQYLRVLEAYFAQASRWLKASYKLCYVLTSTLRTIAEKGFCKPQESDEPQAGDGTGEGKLEEGTGLGSGTGKENVSELIEDESQVEGLQGEEETKPEKKSQQDDDDDDDKAIEMGQDFEGDLEDQEGDDEKEQDGDDELDDEIQDLDPLDPNSVDEKLWNGEQKEDDKEPKTSDDRPSNDEGQGPSETVAKDEDHEESKKPKDGEEQGREGEPEKMEEDGAEEGEGPDLESQAPDAGAKMDEHVPEAGILDLPEDLNLDGKEDMDEEMDIDDQGGDGSDAGTEEGSGREDDGHDKFPEDIADDDTVRGGSEQRETDGDKPQDATDDLPMVSQPDMDRNAAGEGAVSGEEKEKGDAPDGTAPRADGAEATNETPQEPGEQDETQKDGAPSLDKTPAPQDGGQADGGADSQPETQTAAADAQYTPLPNPLRHLGDALKEVRRRFQEVMDASSAEQQRQQPNEGQDEDAPMEYAQNDPEEDDTQALGPSGPEESTRLRDLKISDEEPSADVPPPSEDMDVDDFPQQSQPRLQSDRLPIPPTSQTDQHIESALAEDQIRGDANVLAAEDEREDAITSQIERVVEAPATDVEVELRLREWLESGQTPEDAEGLWRQYKALTQDLSIHLCEQLRLILEPTLATRLKGDYRTGKRLNMKKIIPYIASEFTKDKIWLRRTRPSQREYQVLLALDDSKSMAESHSIHLAYETLTLVSKALTRLEVGEVGIIKFGKTVDVLHGFDGVPFSDAVGAKILGSFKFNQTATDVSALVNTSINLLTDARDRKSMSSTSSAELWQLQIIISDGICQDHERLRAMLRWAEELRIMIVFVIVDSLQRSTATTSSSNPSQNSILSMNQVSYKNVNGKMELQMERYLDTFPFQYYVVLRNVEALPEVLTSTLKQFFERSSEQ